MNNKPLSLKEWIEYMHELSSGGLNDSDAFHQAHDQYVKKVITCNIENSIEINNALTFLSSIDSIGTLSLENMIEQLENCLQKTSVTA